VLARSAYECADDTHRCHPVAADWRNLPLRAARADIAVLANVCHLEDGPGAARLISSAASAVRPGGLIVIVDTMTGPMDPGALLQSLHLGLRTRRGRTHARADYRTWCTQAGLAVADDIALPSGLRALVAVKADAASPPAW
jgi:SAM-dependent methyltransferase